MDVIAIHTSPDLTQSQSQPQVGPEQIAQRRELVRAAKVINASEVLGSNNELVFVVDRVTHRAIMRLVDRKTQEVVKQFPPEYVLHLAQDLGQHDLAQKE